MPQMFNAVNATRPIRHTSEQVRLQRGKGRCHRLRASGQADRHREHVVDHQARRRDECYPAAEAGLGDGVRPAAVRMRRDDLAVGHDQDQQQDRKDDDDRQRVPDGRGAGDGERGDDRLRPVRHRGQRIRRECGEPAQHTEALTVTLAVLQRDARLPPAGPQDPFAHHAPSAVSPCPRVRRRRGRKSDGGWPIRLAAVHRGENKRGCGENRRRCCIAAAGCG